jgi:cyclopropane-fatty-acyl-phospholipid synthase
MFDAIFSESRIERLVESLRGQASIPLRIELWNGRRIDLSRDPKVTVRVPSPAALRYFLRPDLNRLGEAYVEGHIKVSGSVHDMFRVAESIARHAGATRPAPRPFSRHTRQRDRQAIEHHYDVSNEFYRLFLDRNMLYSCAYFRGDADTLDQAQENKLDHILTKIVLKPGEQLLDIGCGWGGLVIRAAQKYGARALGITLSQNQYDYARNRIRELGLTDRCEVRLQDYRDVPGERVFDKIVSVGMFEHVGLRNLSVYFGKMRSLLKDDGIVLNHGITSSDPDSRAVGRGASEFIDRYVFPQGELPHISLAVREMAAAGLEVTDVESLRRHYARTCHEWASRLEANRERAIAEAGDKRARIWQIYLAGCAYGFSSAWMNIYQVLACRANSASPLPMTRDYMYRQG